MATDIARHLLQEYQARQQQSAQDQKERYQRNPDIRVLNATLGKLLRRKDGTPRQSLELQLERRIRDWGSANGAEVAGPVVIERFEEQHLEQPDAYVAVLAENQLYIVLCVVDYDGLHTEATVTAQPQREGRREPDAIYTGGIGPRVTYFPVHETGDVLTFLAQYARRNFKAKQFEQPIAFRG